jgi:hypothetical protein
MLRDYVQKMARRILHLPVKPARGAVMPPARDPDDNRLPEPQHTPPMPKVQPPRRPARAQPPEDDDDGWRQQP